MAGDLSATRSRSTSGPAGSIRRKRGRPAFPRDPCGGRCRRGRRWHWRKGGRGAPRGAGGRRGGGGWRPPGARGGEVTGGRGGRRGGGRGGGAGGGRGQLAVWGGWSCSRATP